ncbi:MULTISPECIES: 3-hydroxyacyl-ACP dehydratase FabZ family protein [Virgibacillus]|uniref:3-hydroxyacyl-ACP dehydratase FabZ family protein n=1 Tax=Virgibacillus TaxID=84406 RepID=UPI00179D50F7|nr:MULTISPECIES: hypothetical protein [Virgibacillus]MBU5265964.1 hypothetical protein [Virgibacillus proomii]NWO15091.1 hypothetical protein [Virgibacillus sp.]
MNNYLDYLPQKSPFRFIDEVIDYKQGKYMMAKLYSESLPQEITKAAEFFSPSFITEALAQLGIIFIQFETEPLKENELPVLGSIKMEKFNSVILKVSCIDLLIKKVKVYSNHALLEGIATVKGQVICNGQFGVVKSFKAKE